MQNAWLPLKNLDKPPIRVGGICYFYFTPWENVLQWPDINPLTGSCIGDVVLKDGKQWYRCQVINPNKAYTEKHNSSDVGNYMQCEVTGFLPDDQPDIAYSMNEMRYHRFAIVIVERNGIKRLIGDQFYSAYFSFDYDTSDDSGVRGRKLSFSWMSPDGAPVYLNDINTDTGIKDKPTTSIIVWDYFATEQNGTAIIAMNVLARKVMIDAGRDYSLDTSVIVYPSFVYIREPLTEPIKTRWVNTVLNRGNIPDQVWNIQIVDRYRLYSTREATSFDQNEKTTFYKS